MEIFIVDGKFSSELGIHDKWSWCRIPNKEGKGQNFYVKRASENVYVWIEEGHLASDEIRVEFI